MGEGLICQLDWWLQLNPQWQKKKCFPYRWLSLERRSSDQLLPAGRGNGVLLRDIRLRGINTAWALADNKHPFHTKATVRENLLAIHCQWVYKGYLTCFRIQLTARTNTVFRMTIVPFWKKKKNNNGPIMHLNETRVHISGTVGDGFTQQKYRTRLTFSHPASCSNPVCSLICASAHSH